MSACQGTPRVDSCYQKLGRGEENSTQHVRGSMALPYFRHLISRSMRESLSVVLIHLVYGTLLWEHGQRNMLGLQSFQPVCKVTLRIRGRVPGLQCTGQEQGQGSISGSKDHTDNLMLINFSLCARHCSIALQMVTH